MASLSYDRTNNRWVLQFKTPLGKRRSVSMKATRGRDKGESKAAVMKNHVEELVNAVQYGNSVPPQVACWVETLHTKSPKTHDQLVAAGLVEQRCAPELAQLGPFLDKWFADRQGTKRSTELTWRNAERNLKAFFGADKNLRQITQDDAENFERWLKTNENLSAATVRKRVSISKQMLASACKSRIITENPFHEMKTGSLANKKRQYFVTHQETRKVLDACSNAEWRSLVALARYGALRISSEIRELKWDEINWAADCFQIHAPKTEHHEGDGDRVVPLFPEIRQELSELWEQTEPGEVYVLPNLRHTTNVLPTLRRIIERAGLKVWPKPWHNLRASRATELENQFGAHKATQWCGHTEKIAEVHYWMVTDDAVSEAAGFISDAYLMQQGPEQVGTEEPDDSENPDFSVVCGPLQGGALSTTGARGT